jgi:DNA-binding NtrC family response regulator
VAGLEQAGAALRQARRCSINNVRSQRRNRKCNVAAHGSSCCSECRLVRMTSADSLILRASSPSWFTDGQNKGDVYTFWPIIACVRTGKPDWQQLALVWWVCVMVRSVLVVDRDNSSRLSACAGVKAAGYDPCLAGDAPDAQRQIETAVPGAIALVIINMAEAPHEGIGLLGHLRNLENAPPAIAVLNSAQSDLVHLLLQTGAADVLFHPLAAQQVCAAIGAARKIAELDTARKHIVANCKPDICFADLVGESDEMRRAVDLGRRAARLKMPVLLEGEPGVGKQMMARAIHNESGPDNLPFIAVDCTRTAKQKAIDNLFAPETGQFFAALGGSLFLSEIGHLPLDAQERLATLLAQASPSEPGGHGRVRLLASSRHDMIALVKSGGFREDLYYRLNVFPIWVPPLRERLDDIPALAGCFVQRFAAQEARPVRAIAPEAIALLRAYEWPGNISELENTILHAVMLSQGEVLGVREFPQISAHVAALAGTTPNQLRAGGRRPVTRAAGSSGLLPRIGAADLPDGYAAMAEASHVSPTAPGWFADGSAHGIRALTERGDVRPLDEIEADVIRLALGRYRGRMTEVAKRLGIGRSTLYRKMREFGLGGRNGPGF